MLEVRITDVSRAEVDSVQDAWLARTGPRIGVRGGVAHADVLEGRLRDDGIARAASPSR